MRNEVWVAAELDQGECHPLTWELLTMAREVAQEVSGQVAIAGAGPAAKLQRQIMDQRVEVAYLADFTGNQLRSCQWTNVLAAAIQRFQPQVVLVGATTCGREVAARVAGRLNLPLVPDPLRFTVVQGEVTWVTPVYGGRATANLGFAGRGTTIVTVSRGYYQPSVPAAVDSLRVEELPVSLTPETGKKILGIEPPDTLTMDISEADRIVCGGRGTADREGQGFALLEELAETLGAAVAGSRALRDAGFINLNRQIGQTGKRVQPTLLISCGVSGAIHHTAGLKDSRYLIAVNTDHQASIFKLADLSVVGDAYQVLPALIEQLRQRGKGGKIAGKI